MIKIILATLFILGSAEPSAFEPDYRPKVISAREGNIVTRIVDEEMKTVCYTLYRPSVGVSISCVTPR